MLGLQACALTVWSWESYLYEIGFSSPSPHGSKLILLPHANLSYSPRALESFTTLLPNATDAPGLCNGIFLGRSREEPWLRKMPSLPDIFLLYKAT